MIRRIMQLGMLFVAMATLAFAQGAAPPTPTDLTAEALAEPSVQLTWKAPMGLWGFRIYRSVGDQAHFQPLDIPTASKVYYDRDVVAGNTYYYYVTAIAFDLGGHLKEGQASNIASAAVKGEPTKGTITGTVTDGTTGQGIPWTQIQLFRISSGSMQSWVQVLTNDAGHYQAVLDTGTYILHAQPPFVTGITYNDEWYEDASDDATAKHVPLDPGAVVAVNFTLSRLTSAGPTGTISGTVVDEATNLPIQHIKIFFFRTSSIYNSLPVAETDANGQYSAVVDTGTYLLRAQPPLGSSTAPGYQPEWYDNASSSLTATPVHVTPGLVFTANFALSKGVTPELAAVSGTVTDETSGKPIAHATVVFMRTIQDMSCLGATSGAVPGLGEECVEVPGLGLCNGVIWKGVTDSLGHYSATVVKGKSYIALAAAWGYIPEFYDNKPNPVAADIIAVKGDLTNIDFALATLPGHDNSISGVVRDTAGQGVPSRIVLIPTKSPLLFKSVLFGLTDAKGAYAIGNVGAGTYLVLAVPFSEYAPAFYKNGAYGVVKWKEADAVNVTGDVTGINIGVVRIASRGLAQLIGRILTPGHLPIDGAKVFATSDRGEILGVALSEASGEYVLDAVAPGTITLIADKDGYNYVETSVVIAPNTYVMNNLDVTMSLVNPLSVDEEPTVPASYQVFQNYPNPFNPSTTINFELPAPAHVRLTVLNVLGQEVATLANGMFTAGRHHVVWNGIDGTGSTLASGMYFYKLGVNGATGSHTFTQVRKMLLLK